MVGESLMMLGDDERLVAKLSARPRVINSTVSSTLEVRVNPDGPSLGMLPLRLDRNSEIKDTRRFIPRDGLGLAGACESNSSGSTCASRFQSNSAFSMVARLADRIALTFCCATQR
jgi:hypothetical protein